jgi:hypothetical protein
MNPSSITYNGTFRIEGKTASLNDCLSLLPANMSPSEKVKYLHALQECHEGSSPRPFHKCGLTLTLGGARPLFWSSSELDMSKNEAGWNATSYSDHFDVLTSTTRKGRQIMDNMDLSDYVKLVVPTEEVHARYLEGCDWESEYKDRVIKVNGFKRTADYPKGIVVTEEGIYWNSGEKLPEFTYRKTCLDAFMKAGFDEANKNLFKHSMGQIDDWYGMVARKMLNLSEPCLTLSHFVGGYGIGKSWLTEVVPRILFGNLFSTRKTTDIHARFSKDSGCPLWITYTEAEYSEERGTANRMKQDVTEDMIDIERKNKDPYKVRNRAIRMMNANFEQSLIHEWGNRRDMVILGSNGRATTKFRKFLEIFYRLEKDERYKADFRQSIVNYFLSYKPVSSQELEWSNSRLMGMFQFVALPTSRLGGFAHQWEDVLREVSSQICDGRFGERIALRKYSKKTDSTEHIDTLSRKDKSELQKLLSRYSGENGVYDYEIKHDYDGDYLQLSCPTDPETDPEDYADDFISLLDSSIIEDLQLTKGGCDEQQLESPSLREVHPHPVPVGQDDGTVRDAEQGDRPEAVRCADVRQVLAGIRRGQSRMPGGVVHPVV